MENKRNFPLFGVIGSAAVVVFFIFVLLVSGPFAFISPGQRGVEVNLGKVTGKVYAEGWYFYNSIAKDIVTFDTRSQVDTVKVAAASQDLQDVAVEVAVQYRLDTSRVAKILETIGKQDDVKQKILDPAVQETVKASTALFPVANIIKERPAVKTKIETLLVERLAPYGVVLEELSIKDINFSEQFSKAIEDKQTAEQRKLQAEYEAAADVARAQGKAQAQKIEGEAIRTNPEILTLRAIERWNGILPIYMGSNAPLPFLNIK